MDQEQVTLRDTIAEQVGKLEETPSEPQAPVTPAAPAEGASDDSQGRARDEQGRFVAQEKSKEPTEREKLIAAGTIKPAPAQVAQVPAKPHPARPSSWKKDYWEDWGKLDPRIAEYINQREGEYAKGVSAYKTEFDRAKPIADAVGQFSREIQMMRTTPQEFISNLGNAHRTLALGTPEQKLSMFLKIAQDYQVPVQSLFVRGQDGQIYFNPQVQPYQPQAQQPTQDIRSTVQDILMQEKAQQELASFESEVEQKYPHYETVKAEMAQLLDSGFCKTLESAYETALRLPQHSDLFEQAQQAKLEADKKAAAEKTKAEAERARRNTVSPRTSTPAVRSGEGKPRSIRESIESAVDTVGLGDTARV